MFNDAAGSWEEVEERKPVAATTPPIDRNQSGFCRDEAADVAGGLYEQVGPARGERAAATRRTDRAGNC